LQAKSSRKPNNGVRSPQAKSKSSSNTMGIEQVDMTDESPLNTTKLRRGRKRKAEDESNNRGGRCTGKVVDFADEDEDATITPAKKKGNRKHAEDGIGGEKRLKKQVRSF
jgi:hypothetical protein